MGGADANTAVRIGRAVLAGLGLVLGLTMAACDGGAPAVEAPRPAAPRPGGAAPVDNVVLVSIDTLRADRLQPLGYPRPTSPGLLARAGSAVVFEHARAQAPQTAPSHASLFTSEFPGAHGIVNVHGSDAHVRTLPPGVTTLAQRVAGAGLETAAFVCGGNLTRRMGVDRGFATWDETNQDVRDRLAAALAWLDAPDRGRFLLFVHTYQTHAPYLPPPDIYPRFTDVAYRGPLRDRLQRYLILPFDEQWRGGVGADYWEGMIEFGDEDVRFLSDLYDGEIAFVDDALTTLLARVLDGPLGERTAVILLSDHGEEFRDHGKFQHDQVFEELLRVPLLVWLPGPLRRAGWTGRVDRIVDLVDVAPTVAELLGLAWDDLGWEGRSLVPLMDPGAGAPPGWDERPSFSELVVEPGPQHHRTVTWHGWKYVHRWQQNIDRHWRWMFDLSRDPGERENLVDSADPEVAAIRARLEGLLEEQTRRLAGKAVRLGPAGRAELDAAQRELLIGLGYVDGGGTGGDDGR